MEIKTVIVYSTADKYTLPVRFADEAVCIGPPPSKDSYLKISNIIAAAEITNADAIHPGYGFLSENAMFARICAKNDIKFIGASPEHLELFSNKAAAKKAMKAIGLPIIPDSNGIVHSFEEAEKICKKLGYPVMIKAAAGGGGKSMHEVGKKEDLKENWNLAVKEAETAFGNSEMYIEKLIENARHIEIQIAGDRFGKACHLSERDCSIQLLNFINNKLVEETPSPFMTDDLREKMCAASIKAMENIKFEGVGTLEFLVDEKQNFYFMEMNPRIKAEHPVTEQVVDYDLVKEQILIAAGTPISGKNYYPRMHSIECRINARDPFDNFKFSPFEITELNVPGGHGIRVDTHVYVGYAVPKEYDSMIAKIIATAQTRPEAIAKMKRALEEFYIEGVKTTIPFHRQLLENEDFVKGNYTTKFAVDFKLDENYDYED